MRRLRAFWLEEADERRTCIRTNGGSMVAGFGAEWQYHRQIATSWEGDTAHCRAEAGFCQPVWRLQSLALTKALQPHG